MSPCFLKSLATACATPRSRAWALRGLNVSLRPAQMSLSSVSAYTLVPKGCLTAMPQRYMTIVLMPLLGLLTLAAVLLFPGLGASPIERAEIYFLDGARNMLERQDYL